MVSWRGEPARAFTAARLRREMREGLQLALPLVAAQLAQMSMSFVDALMAGRLGTRFLAAAALGNSLFFPTLVVGLGILAASGPMVSQAHGAGDREKVSLSVRQALWLALALSVPAVALLWQGSVLLRWIGEPEPLIQLAADYLRALCWGVPPLFVFGALRNFLEGLSRPRVVTLITVAGVALNVFCNTVLMYGKLGFPVLLLTGCGWATVIVYWSMAGAAVALILSTGFLAGFRPFGGLPRRREVLVELLALGWPIGVSQGLEVAVFATTAFLMGWLGSATLAAHQIALQCAAFTFMVPVGISIATSVRVGQAVGRRDLLGARLAGWAGMVLAALFMLGAAAFFLLWPRQLVALFLEAGGETESQTVALAVSLLGIAAVFQVFDGIQVAALGALRGLKDTRSPMLIALLAYWGVGLPAGVGLAFGMRWGGRGLWWGLVVGLGSAALLLSVRFLRQSRPERIDTGRAGLSGRRGAP